MRLFNLFNPKNILIDKNYYHIPITIDTNWFNSSWRVRTELIIDTSIISTNLSNIYLDIFLTFSNIDFSKTSVNDIRIVDENNNLINYWIESYNSSYIHIIALFPELQAAQQNKFYIYYDNPAASSISTGSIFDNFEDFEGNGNISRRVTGGTCVISQDYVKSGKNSAKITLPTEIYDGTFFYIGNKTNDFVLEYSILSTNVSLGAVFGTCNGAPPSNWGQSFLYFYNDYIETSNGTDRFYTISVNTLTWYDITEIHHLQQRQFDLIIKTGDKKLYSTTSLNYYYNNIPNYLKIIDPSSGGCSAITYIDNIRVYNYNPYVNDIKINFGNTEYK